MNLDQIRIGYVPYSLNLSAPADRRRFPYFAQRNNVVYEIADINTDYDIIILPALSNLSIWFSYKRKHPNTRFIFEMVDSLILTSDLFRTLFKGPGRYLLGKESRFYFDYRKPIKKWIGIADAVLCSSEEIKKNIINKNKNVFVSFDFMQGEIKKSKIDFSTGEKIKLVWEGQSVVLHHLLQFKGLFKRLNSFCELHIITDELIPKFGKLKKVNTEKMLAKLPIETFFHKWEIYKNYGDLIKFDCGIIPLDKNNAFGWHKPANKLISFWFCGLPTLTSDTPAYKRMMNRAETDWYCNTEDEWFEKIMAVKNMSSSERKLISEKNRAFVQQHFSDEALDKVWFDVLEKTVAL